MQIKKDKSLKEKLFAFWANNQDYFEMARNANRELTEERKNLLRYIGPQDKVLDVGCGTSEIGKHISDKAHYFGIDVSFIALKMANDCKFERFNLLQGNAESVPFKDAAFDVIISTYSLEHFISLREILDEMKRVLKPSGKLILLCSTYDCFYSVPPSLDWLGSAQKLFFMLKQLLKYVAILFFKKCYFEIIKKPAVFVNSYKPDGDLVCIITTAELINYLRAQNFEILYARKRCAEDGKKRMSVKNLIKKTRPVQWFTRYWNRGSMIVAQNEKICNHPRG